MSRLTTASTRNESVSALTRRYITEHMSISHCLRKGLINYSALAREICDEFDLKNFDAVVVACRRYHARLKGGSNYDNKVLALLRRAKVRVRTKIATVILEKTYALEKLDALQQRIRKQRADFVFIEGESGDVVITNDDQVDAIEALFKNQVVKTSEGLAQITMVFDERIEETPGVVAFIYGLLADHKINIVEEMSCWRDLILIVDEKDIFKATQLLSVK